MNLKDKKLFLLDMDGTIYLDTTLFRGTIEFLSKIREKGASYLFLTNNSSKSVSAYVDKLASIGIQASADDFLTSTDATILHIKKNYPTAKFYSFGTESFTNQLRESGIIVTTEIEDGIDGLILSNDTELTFKKLDDASRLLLNKDLIYIATNPDWVCPTSYGYVPDCGSFAEMLNRATGRTPRFIGKPEPAMVLLAIERMGLKLEDAVMIGDRVYTDIASGYNAGIDTILVLSGEGTLKDAENAETKPTYIVDGIWDLVDKV